MRVRNPHSPETREKIRKTLLGHRVSEETRAKIRAATLRQIANGKIGKMSESAKLLASERMKEYHRTGKINPHRPCPESVKEKLRAQKLSPEHVESLRAHALQQAKDGRINKSGLRLGPAVGLPKMWEKCRGSHAFGRVERGRLDHANACAWRVRSPAGVEYEFTNAREWCRQNIHLFDDPAPESKEPLWLRAANGFSSMKERACSWRGWTLITWFEMRDWLARNPLPEKTQDNHET